MSSLIRDLAASTPEMLAAFGDEALVGAALAFEAALARALAAEGVIPQAAAAAIAAACEDPTLDLAGLAEEAAQAGTLAIALVRRLRAKVAETDPEAARFAHFGATSQDLADTAMMLMAKAAGGLLERDLNRLIAALSSLAEHHAATPQLGRTLLQPALPITFGLKVSQWMLALDAAAARLRGELSGAAKLQFGGAVGTFAGLGKKGPAVGERMASALGLGVSPIPWHARRDGVAGLAGALGILTGALGKIARDIALLGQGEVGEAFEPRIPGRGGSSAMAHKRNPTGCQMALSAAERTPGLVAAILGGLPQEHERGLGGWQAEAPVLAELFEITHGAVVALAPVIEGLDVDAAAMARNLTDADVGTDVGLAEALVSQAREVHRQQKGPEAGDIDGDAVRDAARRLFEAGLQMRREVLGDAWVDDALARVTPFTADFQSLITRSAWREIWSRPGLDQRTRRLLVVAMTASLGRWEEFRLHVRSGLSRKGFTKDELKETLMQTAVYAGVPAANTAFAEASAIIGDLGGE